MDTQTSWNIKTNTYFQAKKSLKDYRKRFKYQNNKKTNIRELQKNNYA